MDPIFDMINLDEKERKECKERLVGITPSIIAQMGHRASIRKLALELNINPVLSAIIVCTYIEEESKNLLPVSDDYINVIIKSYSYFMYF